MIISIVVQLAASRVRYKLYKCYKYTAYQNIEMVSLSGSSLNYAGKLNELHRYLAALSQLRDG